MDLNDVHYDAFLADDQTPSPIRRSCALNRRSHPPPGHQRCVIGSVLDRPCVNSSTVVVCDRRPSRSSGGGADRFRARDGPAPRHPDRLPRRRGVSILAPPGGRKSGRPGSFSPTPDAPGSSGSPRQRKPQPAGRPCRWEARLMAVEPLPPRSADIVPDHRSRRRNEALCLVHERRVLASGVTARADKGDNASRSICSTAP